LGDNPTGAHKRYGIGAGNVPRAAGNSWCL